MLERHQARNAPTTHYNEVILDVGSVQAHLPHAIEAVLLPPLRNEKSQSNPSRPTYEEKARKAHAALLQTYGLDAEQLPLLRLDLVNGGESPFSI
jgi:hypothetical protein